MKLRNQILTISVLLSLMLFPTAAVYGVVTTLETDKSVYNTSEKIIFSGMEEQGRQMVTLIIRDPVDEKVALQGDPSSDHDGYYEISPISIKSVFTSIGIYKAIAVVPTQPINNETAAVHLEYDGKNVKVVQAYNLKFVAIPDKTINEEEEYSFIVKITDDSITSEEYSLGTNSPAGAQIDPKTGKFTWTPTEAQGPGSNLVDIVASAGISQISKTIIITVSEIQVAVIDETPTKQIQSNPSSESDNNNNNNDDNTKTPDTDTSDLPKTDELASFVSPDQDPQFYVDRYNSEPVYKDWFDANFPQYSSIQQAVGLPEPFELASFVSPDQDPQFYVDRYNSEPVYKDWFDANFPQYSSIQQAVGLPEPFELASFVSPDQDPQFYVDRYNSEPVYKDWFDANFPQYSSIQQAVGLPEPFELASFVSPDQDPQFYVDRYNSEPVYKDWFDANFPQYSSIQQAVGLPEPEIGTCGNGTSLINGVCTVLKVEQEIPPPQTCFLFWCW